MVTERKVRQMRFGDRIKMTSLYPYSLCNYVRTYI